jgi:hypothetical protein
MFFSNDMPMIVLSFAQYKLWMLSNLGLCKNTYVLHDSWLEAISNLMGAFLLYEAICLCLFFGPLIIGVTELTPQWCYSTLYIAQTLPRVHCLWLNRINRGVECGFCYEACDFMHCCLSCSFANDYNVSQCKVRDSP